MTFKYTKKSLFSYRGPKQAILSLANTSVAKVEGLIPGNYQFKLTVYDDKNAFSSSTVNVSVIQSMTIKSFLDG